MKPIIFLTLALTACGNSEQRLVAHCTALGEGPGTLYYPYCIQSAQELQQRRAEMWSGVAVSGAAMLQPPPTIYVHRY